jgi:hypothetical protein
MTAIDQLEALLAAVAEPMPRFGERALTDEEQAAVDAWYDRVGAATTAYIERGPALLACARALKALHSTPAVRQVLGTNHTAGCKCPMCAAAEALKMLEGK